MDKRTGSYQVTMPPQRRADGDLAICGCYEVDWTLRAPRVGGGAARPGLLLRSKCPPVTYAERVNNFRINDRDRLEGDGEHGRTR